MNAYEIDLTQNTWRVEKVDTLRRVIQISVDDKVVNNVVGACVSGCNVGHCRYQLLPFNR